jgi:hypothetical protein
MSLVLDVEVLVLVVEALVSAAEAVGMTGISDRVIASVIKSEISRRVDDLRCCLLAFMGISFLS